MKKDIKRNAPTPYLSVSEYQRDLTGFADLLLARLIIGCESDIAFFRHCGLPITQRHIEEVLTETENIINPGLAEWRFRLLDFKEYIELRVKVTDDFSITPFKFISSTFELSEFEELALLLALCPYLDRKYEKIFDLLGGYKEIGAPSVGTVSTLFNLMYGTDDSEGVSKLLSGADKLHLIFEFQTGFCGLASPIIPHNNIVCEAMGFISMDNNVVNSCRYYMTTNTAGMRYKPEYPLYAEDRIEKVFNLTNRILCYGPANKARIILLHGNDGAGRMFTLLHCALRLGISVLEVDVKKFVDCENLKARLDSLEREYILRRPIICLRNCDYSSDSRDRIAIEGTIEYLSSFSPILFITSSNDSAIVSHRGSSLITAIEVKLPNYNQTTMIFQKNFMGYDIAEDVNEEYLAARFILTPGDIKKVLEYAQLLAFKDDTKKITTAQIIMGVTQLHKRELETLGDFIPCHYTIDDIITTPNNIEMMKLAVNHIKYRNLIMDKWGFSKKSSYGNNVCVLFYGAPGSGKTMAAQVIANELGMELFRVDASQLTSKYIGETAKNIRSVFDGAKGSNIILFFDEADSIFAKRTNQTNDATDRYANSDTSFLLQKIEDYDGMVLLSTNLLQNIDDAFRRRITYMINFAKPDINLRKKLWQHLVTEKMPFDDIDYDFLSGFELVGSDIKSIMISACYMAAGNGDIITMPYLIKALSIFMNKKGTPLIAEDLKQYRELLT